MERSDSRTGRKNAHLYILEFSKENRRRRDGRKRSLSQEIFNMPNFGMYEVTSCLISSVARNATETTLTGRTSRIHFSFNENYAHRRGRFLNAYHVFVVVFRLQRRARHFVRVLHTLDSISDYLCGRSFYGSHAARLTDRQMPIIQACAPASCDFCAYDASPNAHNVVCYNTMHESV